MTLCVIYVCAKSIEKFIILFEFASIVLHCENQFVVKNNEMLGKILIQ